MFSANLQLWKLLGGGTKRSPHLQFCTQQHAKEATDSSKNGCSSGHSTNCRAGFRGGT